MGIYAVHYTYTNANGVTTKGTVTVIGNTLVKVNGAFDALYSAPKGASYKIDATVCVKAID